MAYVGNQIATTFSTIPSVQRFNGDGSDTTFTLSQTVTSVQDILVSVDGVVQDSNAYTVPDGTTLTFSAAPSSGTGNIVVNYLGLTDGRVTAPEANKGNFKHGGMFRTNAQSMDSDVTIAATENANVTGPLTIASGSTLTIESGGNVAIL